MTYMHDFFNLLLPSPCVACGTTLVKNEKVVCLKCRYELPRTRFESFRDNPVARLFWGRVPIEYANSYFRYQKGSRYQSLIHDLKYRDRRDIGREFGRLLGLELSGSGFEIADMILPVPLNRKKQLKRGYNQCDPICEGISESLGIPYFVNLMERPLESGSQTDKSRTSRWRNVEGSFRVKLPEKLLEKHILLADDVITTGSTLEACANTILEIEGTKVSIATLAVALKSF